MTNFATPLRVGLVTAAAAGAFLIGLSFIGGGSFGKGSGYRVYAMFSDATGLGVRSRVQIAGIPVGQVEKVELDQTRSEARVWLRIQKGVQLHKDASVTKRSESILGDFLLDVSPGSPSQPLLQDGDELGNVLRQPGMNEIMTSVSKISNDVSDITGNLRRVLGSQEGEQNLRAIVEGLAHVTQKLEKTLDASSGRLEATLANFQAFSGDLRRLSAGESGDVVAILKNTREATAEARDILKSLQDAVGADGQPGAPGAPGASGQVADNKTLHGIRASMDRLDKTLRNVQEITDKINRGEGTVGHLINDDKLAKNLDKASDNLNGLLGGINNLKIEVHERSEFLVGNLKPGSTGHDLQANTAYNPWTKNYFGLRIMPKPDKWYGVELVDDPRGLTKQVKYANTVTDGQGAPSTSPLYPPNLTQITTERQLKFSAYIAKRYGVVSGRFGLLENTGGFGMQVHLLNDKLTLSADAFEFANPLKDHPRVKLYADYKFMDHLLVTAGADDFVNKRIYDADNPSRIISGRDFFIGAGFYFSDDDLKTLIGSIPRP